MIRQCASDSSIGNVSLIDVTISLRIAIAHQLVLTKVGILQKVVSVLPTLALATFL